MRPSLGLGSKSRIHLIASAALAVLAMTAFSDPVGASSGGIGRSSGDEPATRSNGKYNRIWFGFTGGERRWANRTAACESGRNPRAIGGGGMYRGAFQFMRSTWNRSPRSPGGDPIAYSYRTQAVVAVLLKRRDGAGHWPVCG
jgi:hypothetical protein